MITVVLYSTQSIHAKPPFSPLDKIGQQTMRNLDIANIRAKLGIYAKSGLLPLGTDGDFIRLSENKDK
jgi:argininosuccinate synthase